MKTTSVDKWRKLNQHQATLQGTRNREFTAKLVQILNFGFSWTVCCCCCWPTSNDENGCNSGNFLLFCYRRKGGDGFGEGIKEGSKQKTV